MDARMHCPRCSDQPARVGVFIGPAFVVDVARCSLCGETTCGHGLEEMLRLAHVHRPPAERSGKTS